MPTQTINTPLLDGGEVFGPSFVQNQTISLPTLDGGSVFAPTLTGTVTAGLVVKQGATTLDCFAKSFLDELAGPGQFSLAMENDDADLPDFDEVVSFYVDGVQRFAGPVRAKDVTTHSSGEEADQVTVLSGPGRLATTDKSIVAPSRGWDALPVEVTRTQSYVAPDFPGASTWPNSKRIRRVDIGTPYSPHRAIPEWYVDKSAWAVAPNRPNFTGTDAPVGQWLFRSEGITLSAGNIAIIFGGNNKIVLFFDGALIGDIDNSPSDANQVRLEVSAGTHHLAGAVVNQIRDSWMVASIYTVDDDGLLDDLVWSSDYNTVNAVDPATMPGVTAGEAIRLLLEEAQANGELTTVSLGFSDTLDSDGQPWTVVPEITTDVGRSFYEYLEALSDWLCDVQMAPGGDVLRAWNWGTRGALTPVVIAATTNPATSEVQALSFQGRHIRANRLWIRYRKGYTEVDLSGSDPTVSAFLDLSDVNDEDTAQSIGTNLLQLRQDPSYAGTLTLAPVSSTPYDDFDNGDTVSHPADPGGTTASRVRSISLREDEDNDALTWDVELHDVRLSVEERQQNWLKRSAMGALAGGARVTSRSGESIAPSQRLSTKTVAEFSFQDPVDGAITAKDPAKSSGNLIEFYVEVTTEDGSPTSSASEVKVYLDGVSLGTCTVPAGEDAAEFDLEAQKVYRNVDRLRAEVVTVGGGVNGITVQVRAI